MHTDGKFKYFSKFSRKKIKIHLETKLFSPLKTTGEVVIRYTSSGLNFIIAILLFKFFSKTSLFCFD